jgi:hypothetical protein
VYGSSKGECEVNVEELMETLYQLFGTDSGCLFGLQPSQRHIAKAIVIAILRIQFEKLEQRDAGNTVSYELMRDVVAKEIYKIEGRNLTFSEPNHKEHWLYEADTVLKALKAIGGLNWTVGKES